MKKAIILWLLLPVLCTASAQTQHSIARLWNEELLQAISKDFARPPIQARNLHHIAIAMYDAWALYDSSAQTYFLGKSVNGFSCPYRPTPPVKDLRKAQEETLSFAVYRLMRFRFANSPDVNNLFPRLDFLMDSLGYQRWNTSINYKAGPAETGNYLAYKLLEYGLQDGSNESENFTNQFYNPVNPPLPVQAIGNFSMLDLNRWQPLQFFQFVDQSGNPSTNAIPAFQSPEWGQVLPFSLKESDSDVYQRNGNNYTVYHDPGPPALIDTTEAGGMSAEFKWNHSMVAIWSALLDPADNVLMDISPASIGNNQPNDYPTTIEQLPQFYNLFGGGDFSPGHPINPKTGQPYTPQVVHRGDFTRVLAEFWADGPKSETPPGHWFSILNYVNDQPGASRQVRGMGPICDNLEWDVKGYFALGGAMHDAAITAWGIKGWYDSSRPNSVIRAMAERGQSSDPLLPNYHPAGLPLVPGYIEMIQPGDPLAGFENTFVNQIKLKAWRGPNAISNPATSTAGVGWIRAKEWWPYQRPTFVTPPFAGYISGHSTYSRAAAEVLTAFTGDPYFPGGMGEFFCPKHEFLVFEDGPSTNITLQWATYRDASDQCSLSRIYGGIHPPMDDIPGRLIGMQVGQEAFEFATQYFEGKTPSPAVASFELFPNPTLSVVQLELPTNHDVQIQVFSADGRLVLSTELPLESGRVILDLSDLPAGVYSILGLDLSGEKVFLEKLVKL